MFIARVLILMKYPEDFINGSHGNIHRSQKAESHSVQSHIFWGILKYKFLYFVWGRTSGNKIIFMEYNSYSSPLTGSKLLHPNKLSYLLV